MDGVNSGVEASRDRRTSSSLGSALVLRMPNEVLSYIFELGALGEEKRGISPWQYSVYYVYWFQRSVSGVSRRFRDVAVRTPRLWTIIYFLGWKLESQEEYITECFDRSGSLPCSIFLDFQEEELKSSIVEKVMVLVNSSIYRLERFLARTSHIQILDQIMGYLNKPAPLLTALELSYNPDHVTFIYGGVTKCDYRFPVFDGFMPKLSTLLFEEVQGPWWPGYDLKNLTALGLTYRGLTHNKFRTILEGTPLLRELSIQGSSFELTKADHPINLKYLEHLELASLRLGSGRNIISSIYAPNLKSLILAEMLSDNNVELIYKIVEPSLSFPKLASLYLVNFKTSEGAFVRILHAYPNMETLGLYRIGEEDIGANWMHLLEGTTNTGGSPLCPNLKTLRCEGIKLEEIKNMMARRAAANIPLPKLQLSHRRPIYTRETSALLWLQQNTQFEFADIGLDFHVY